MGSMGEKIIEKIYRSGDKAFLSELLYVQSPLYQRIWSRSRQEIDVRLNIHFYVWNFLKNHKAQITNSSYLTQASSKIWVYWAQGERNMPEIVRTCINQLYSTNNENNIVLLSDENISTFITLPDYIYEKIHFNKTHFSDILRIALLAKYGGVWIDATCYCSGSINPLLKEVQKTGFFAYSRCTKDLFMLSSWFLISRPNELIPRLLRDALYSYWENNDELEHYFLFHFIFEAMYNLDNEFRNSWDSSFHLDAYCPHVLQGKLFEKFDIGEWNKIMDLSSVHKLTYKINVKSIQKDIPKTYLSYILSKKYN